MKFSTLFQAFTKDTEFEVFRRGITVEGKPTLLPICNVYKHSRVPGSIYKSDVYKVCAGDTDRLEVVLEPIQPKEVLTEQEFGDNI